MLIDDTTSGKHRANDVAFDPEAGTLAAVSSTAYLRTLGVSQQRVRLVAVDGADERVDRGLHVQSLAVLAGSQFVGSVRKGRAATAAAVM